MHAGALHVVVAVLPVASIGQFMAGIAGSWGSL
jgi:hypothetical protein